MNGARSPSLLLAILVICMTVAFCHLSLSAQVVEPVSFYTFGAREPFIYRILLPAVFSLLPVNLLTCRTPLPFPLEHCLDVAALGVDWLALVFSCFILAHAFRILVSHDQSRLRQPALVVPLFLWMVIFDYVLVMNRSMYYPFDFLQLLFFSSAVWVGVSARKGYWYLPLLAFVSALNKEDAIFLPLTAGLFAYWVGELHRRMLVSIGLGCVAVLLAKYVSLQFVRQGLGLAVSAPTLYENHLSYNLQQLMNPLAWCSWMSIFGGAAFILALPLRRIARLKLVIAGIVLAYLPVVFAVGEAREIRLFGPLICAVLLPVMLAVDSLLFEASDARAAATAPGLRQAASTSTMLRLGGAIIGLALAAVAVKHFLKHSATEAGASHSWLSVPGVYQDLLSCEGTRIHSCRTGDGVTYDCLFSNDYAASIELSDIKIWNYDASNNFISDRNIDTHFEIPPGRTVLFRFHTTDENVRHGRLCRVDPQRAAVEHWADAN